MDNYYKLFALDKNASTKTLGEQLFKEKKKWIQRLNAPSPEKQYEAHNMLKKLENALEIFKDDESRKKYDFELFGEKEKQQQKIEPHANRTDTTVNKSSNNARPENNKTTTVKKEPAEAVSEKIPTKGTTLDLIIITAAGVGLLTGLYVLEKQQHSILAFILAIAMPFIMLVISEIGKSYTILGKNVIYSVYAYICAALPLLFLVRRRHFIFLVIFLFFTIVEFYLAMSKETRIGLKRIVSISFALMAPCILLYFNYVKSAGIALILAIMIPIWLGSNA